MVLFIVKEDIFWYNKRIERGKKMMIEMNKKLDDIMKKTNDKEKIRLFYELAKYIDSNTEETEDTQMNDLFSDIKTIIDDIENL